MRRSARSPSAVGLGVAFLAFLRISAGVGPFFLDEPTARQRKALFSPVQHRRQNLAHHLVRPALVGENEPKIRSRPLASGTSD